MEQQPLRLEYKVGIFIGLGLLAAMITILLLGGNKTIFTRYTYLRARFTEVQGLFPGSVVSLAGIPVGNVKDIEFVSTENKLEITMKIDRAYASRLVEGTVAEIKTQGALGDKYVYLVPGAPTNTPLESGTLVEAAETDFLKMLTSREEGLARVIDLIKEMHVLVASINGGGQAGTMFKNLAEASVKVNSTLSQLDKLLGALKNEIPEDKKLKQAVTSLASILEKVDHGKGTLGQLINDPTIHQNLKAFLGGSARTQYMKDMIRETIQHSEVAR